MISIQHHSKHEKLFPYFTDSTLLASWLCLDAKVALKEQGPYELYFDEDKSINNTCGCKILSFSQEYLMVNWKGPDIFKAQETIVTFIFHDHMLNLLHTGFLDKEEELFFERAWSLSLENLEKI